MDPFNWTEMLELNSDLQGDPETLNLADCSVLLGFVLVDLFEFVDGGLPCAGEDLWDVQVFSFVNGLQSGQFRVWYIGLTGHAYAMPMSWSSTSCTSLLT
jgi:hypothetical protein